jgi:hypothetical protein
MLPSCFCGWNGYAGLKQFSGLVAAHSAVPKSIALDRVTSARCAMTPTPSEKRSVKA